MSDFSTMFFAQLETKKNDLAKAYADNKKSQGDVSFGLFQYGIAADNYFNTAQNIFQTENLAKLDTCIALFVCFTDQQLSSYISGKSIDIILKKLLENQVREASILSASTGVTYPFNYFYTWLMNNFAPSTPAEFQTYVNNMIDDFCNSSYQFNIRRKSDGNPWGPNYSPSQYPDASMIGTYGTKILSKWGGSLYSSIYNFDLRSYGWGLIYSVEDISNQAFWDSVSAKAKSYMSQLGPYMFGMISGKIDIAKNSALATGIKARFDNSFSSIKTFIETNRAAIEAEGLSLPTADQVLANIITPPKPVLAPIAPPPIPAVKVSEPDLPVVQDTKSLNMPAVPVVEGPKKSNLLLYVGAAAAAAALLLGN